MPGRDSPRLMCRVTPGELEHFDLARRRLGLSRQALVRQQLGGLLGPSAAVEASVRPEPRVERVEPAQRAEKGSEPGLTPMQVAGRLRMPEPTVRRLMAAGRIRVEGGTVFYDGEAQT